MRTPLVVGIGIACFGLGALTTNLGERSRGRTSGQFPVVEQGGGGSPSALIPSGGGSGGASEKAAAGAVGRRDRPVPTVEEIIGALDLLDNEISFRQLAPLVGGLDAEGFGKLLADIERDGLEPGRGKALRLVSKHFGMADPRAALAFAADPKNHRLVGGSISAAVTTLVRESPEDALAAVREIDSRHTNRAAMRALMRGLASTEPALLQTWIEEEDVRRFLFKEASHAHSMLAALAAESPAAAASFAAKLPKGQLRNSGISGVAQAWSQRDPKAALAWLDSIEEVQMRRHATNLVVAELAKQDPVAAFAVLDETEGQDRENMVGAIAAALVARDTEGALDWAAGLEDVDERARALRSMAEIASTGERIGRFLELLTDLPDGDRRSVGGDFVGQWAYQDPDATHAWISSIEDDGDRKHFLRSAFGGLSYNDPETVVEMISGMNSEMPDEEGWWLRNAFENLASRDLGAARGAAEGLADGKTKDGAISAMVRAWANTDPEAAASYAFENYEAGPEQRRLIGEVGERWVHTDREAALAWAAGLEAEQRVAASEGLISHLAWNGESELAREALEELITKHPGEASRSGRLENAMSSVMNSLGREDPQAGISLINQLETEDAQRVAIGSLVNGWAAEEPAEARAWAQELEAGPVRDAAVQNIVYRSGDEDVAGTFELALSIENEQNRGHALLHAATVWAKSDGDAARANGTRLSGVVEGAAVREA